MRELHPVVYCDFGQAQRAVELKIVRYGYRRWLLQPARQRVPAMLSETGRKHPQFRRDFKDTLEAV